ncbi:hypothetical protein [Hymenobacter mucosus]|uniref:Uncharacterized protein n=1 Tax=Hymenobacter mucosus TaxID=1411120 RepID=A0A239AGT8_9BACT|nr:hypothetical protein [Hymenobacter mucosus]SNR94601.1 hypothetical protein SAMN06269173_11265 [Hymenobacter mucosus]
MSALPPLPEEDEAWTARLRALQPLGPPEPRPFFFTRLQARLDARQAPTTMLPAWLRRPAYALFLGALVLALNADTAVSKSVSPPTSSSSSSAAGKW